jgi:hypothetical protein
LIACNRRAASFPRGRVDLLKNPMGFPPEPCDIYFLFIPQRTQL